MKIYIVIREFQNGDVQNDFAHTSLRKAKRFIKEDDWGMGELYIEVWEEGNKICKCPSCQNEVYEKELKYLPKGELKIVCENCKSRIEKK